MSDRADATRESAGGARKPRVYLECTTTYASRYNTGIQRTVRSIVGAASSLPGPCLCVPIIYNGRYFETIAGLPAPRRADSAVAPSGVEKLRRAFPFISRAQVRSVFCHPARFVLASIRRD